MFKLESLSKSFTQDKSTLVAVSSVSATIQKGEKVGIIGLSGAGKSTLLRLLSMQDRPDSGSLFIDDVDLLTLKGKDLLRMRKRLGFVFQGVHLLLQKKVKDNVAFPLLLDRSIPKDISSKVDHVLNLVGLSDKANAYPNTLSGGQKQRVGIARALITQPEVLLCDEPTSALDPLTTQSILSCLEDVHAKTQVTLVIITHDMHVVQKLCDRVIVMHEGTFIEDGLVSEVFSNPQHPHTRLILSAHEGL
ncbi:MAG: ATP-binding cassette domain-containing protein [Erysipelotrichia bacterium]|jgi:D-methionine transport system ATP-binding protein|nr:ATP-binding cassette domain-containing protein [Erysipelotrichia bacterium]